MNTRKLVLGSVLGVGLLAGGIIIAQNPPAEDIDAHRHPHLAAAQHHILEAFDSASHAQQTNDFDLHGHAAHAKELLLQASRELKMAADDIDRRH